MTTAGCHRIGVRWLRIASLPLTTAAVFSAFSAIAD